MPGETPPAYVERMAREKAAVVYSRHRDACRVVLGADTVVVLDDEVLGKPREIHPLMALVAVLFLVYFAIEPLTALLT